VTNFLAALLSSGSTTSTTVAGAHKAGTSLLDPIAKPVAWVLEHIYAVVPNYGIAILILSLLWMILIAPLTLKSQRSMLAMQKLQPELKKLQEKHKEDKAAFAQAQMDLFREHGASPWGSCLPMLLPLPVFFALYRVIQGLGHTPPKYLSPSSRMYQDIVAAHGHLNAFGMDLSLNAFSHHGSVAAAAPYWILILILAGTGYLQSAMMMNRNPAAAQNPQMRLMKYLPLVFVVFFIRFPAGVLLYYAMSNVCRIVQQDAMYRFDPKVKALVSQEVQEVEAHTHDIDEQNGARNPGTGSKSASRPPNTDADAASAKRAGATPPRGGGNSAAKDAGARPASKGAGAGSGGAAAGAASGSSRFRALLAAASAQQQATASSKALAAGGNAASSSTSSTSKAATDANGTATSTNGSKTTGLTNGRPPGPGQRSDRKPTPKGGHRTNRKRRGR
jgi:YidC/Oxa1 family membrane protein insertase